METELILGKQYPDMVIPLIKAAKSTIAIIVFDWRWYPDYVAYPIQKFNLEILNAAKKGVKICAITNYKEITELLKNSAIQAKHLIHDKLVHSKIMIIDNKIAIIGSHNYTHSAFSYNHEVSVIIRDPDLCSQLTTHFNNLWQN
jgi:phosphatidylserine/phosphatidylglycerophosphate/cardiolipin synthase-like enzyme